MLVSGAPVYVLYLLVRLCPALVVLRVVFTYVYFNTVTDGGISTIILCLSSVLLRCSLCHCSLFRMFSVGLCSYSRFLFNVFLCLSSLSVLCYVLLVLDMCCVLYVCSFFDYNLRLIEVILHRYYSITPLSYWMVQLHTISRYITPTKRLWCRDVHIKHATT